MDDHVHIKEGYLHALVTMSVLSIVALVAAGLYIWGEHRHVAGYALGREAERMKNPTQEYIESGLSFCWDSGNYYKVKPARGGFRVVR